MFLQFIAMMSVISLLSGFHIKIGFYLTAFWLIVYIYSVYFNIKMRVVQSTLVYGNITNKPLDLKEATLSVELSKSRIVTLAIFEKIIDLFFDDRDGDISKQKFGEANKSIPLGFGLINQLMAGSILALSSAAKNYLLPAVVVDKDSIHGAIEKAKTLKNSWRL
jgi:hypothetical protein